MASNMGKHLRRRRDGGGPGVDGDLVEMSWTQKDRNPAMDCGLGTGGGPLINP
jgi:hypothetical protein